MPESSMFLNTEKTEKSSSNRLFETKFSEKSLIQIRNRSSPRMEPSGTHVSTSEITVA